MSAPIRTFGALLSHDGVCLVEYRAEKAGVRVIDHWLSDDRSTSLEEAAGRLVRMITSIGLTRARIALAIEQFGVFHHVMSLPPAADEVLRPVIQREVQRVFGITDPVFAFTRAGQKPENRGEARAPQQVLIGGAPADAIEALQARLSVDGIEITIATVVPKAIHSLYQATGASLDPTAVLVCLEGGPHLAFFLDGRLELAIDPPIALEGERAPLPVILDQVERGAVYFRQQFRGATATRMLLAAPAADYDELSAALEQRLGVRVKPLFAGASVPEAVVAMGAVLESRQSAPLDLYPHPPTVADRVRSALRGPNGVVAAAAVVAVAAGIWGAVQFASLSSARHENDSLRGALRSSVPAMEPSRKIAETRADYLRQIDFVAATRDERAALSATLQAIAQQAPAGVRFDSLRVVRSASGWTGAIAGTATGGTAAQAVRGLDAFYQSVRGREGVTNATLDQFDYAAPARTDSLRPAAAGPVVAEFHVSFALARPPRSAR